MSCNKRLQLVITKRNSESLITKFCFYVELTQICHLSEVGAIHWLKSISYPHGNQIDESCHSFFYHITWVSIVLSLSLSQLGCFFLTFRWSSHERCFLQYSYDTVVLSEHIVGFTTSISLLFLECITGPQLLFSFSLSFATVNILTY